MSSGPVRAHVLGALIDRAAGSGRDNQRLKAALDRISLIDLVLIVDAVLEIRGESPQ